MPRHRCVTEDLLHIGFYFPEIIESCTAEEGLVEKALNLLAKPEPREMIHDADKHTSPSNPSSLFEGLNGIINKFKCIDHNSQVEFIITEREIFGRTLFQGAAMSKTLPGPIQKVRGWIEPMDAQAQLVEEEEMVSLAAADIQNPLAGLRAQESSD